MKKTRRTSRVGENVRDALAQVLRMDLKDVNIGWSSISEVEVSPDLHYARVYITGRRWTTRTGATTTVKVYGNVDSVTLHLNGVRLGGAKTSTDHIYSWAGVTLVPGANTVTATGTRGGATHTDTVTWHLA